MIRKKEKRGTRVCFADNIKGNLNKRSDSRFGSLISIKNFALPKRSQVTLFIIIAIVIVAAVILLFAFRVPQRFIFPSAPEMQLKNCVESRLKEALGLVSKQGGSIAPVNSLMYKDEKIEYLCYTNQYYQTCVMQQPLLKQHVEREILDYIKPDIDKCYNSLKTDLERKGYSVSQTRKDASVSIEKNNIKVVVSGISAVREEEGISYKKFEASFSSQMYDLIMLTTSILNWEARYGDSDTTTYMIYYPNIKVEKYKQEDGSKIYILTDTRAEEKFVFATRSLSWPAGYGFGLTYKPV